jgi:glycosyltransferase involved in cell wall biosynthesis
MKALLLTMSCLASVIACSQTYYDDKIEFEIIIPSYNNAEWCIKNLQSAVSQRYAHFHVTYVDDCSIDGTGDLVDAFVRDNNLQDKVTVIHNKKRCGAMANWYYTISLCPDHKVVVNLDGDDRLAGPNVLSYLAKMYQTYDIWLTYGQFVEWPQGGRGWCVPMPTHIVENNAFRDFEHMPSHLRTYYAWLFKKIKKEDFMHEGQFVPMTCDQAMMFPMMEMARERHACIAKTLYFYNATNGISDHRINEKCQRDFSKIIRAKKRYPRLEEPAVPLRSDKPLYRKKSLHTSTPLSMSGL